MQSRWSSLLVASLFLTGAAGCLQSAPTNSGDGGTTLGDGGITPYTGLLDDLPLPRLSSNEYAATLHDLVTELSPSVASDVLGVVMPIAATMPADQLIAAANQKHGGFSRLDQTVQQAYADVTFQVALSVGTELTKSEDRIVALLGSCYTSGSTTISPSCLQSFVTKLGEVALRRPPSSDDLAFYATAAPASASPSSALTQLIAVMLQSPRFLYHVESGDQPVMVPAPNVYALDAWELASRLSYQMWGTMPDAALRDAARSGALLTDAGYQAQVDRLFVDARTDTTLRTFFLQWLWPTEELPALDSRNADPTFVTFAGASLPTGALRDHMVNEVLDAATYIIGKGGTFDDFFTNNQSFARDVDLATLYEVTPWDGTSTPPSFPADRGGGLLTRAAFLATGSANTSPIMKGVFIRTGLLCDLLPAPPAAAAAATADLSPTLTTREVVEQLTEQNPNCAGCHKTLINPLGFATEGFDALGRARTMQALFDTNGKVVDTKPVETTSVPEVQVGDMTPSSGPSDLLRIMKASGLVEACFAQRYFRYTFRRLEDVKLDASILSDLTSQTRAGNSLGNVLKNVVQRPEFKQRMIAP